MNASTVLAQIETALRDHSVSSDAMRSAPVTQFCEICDADDKTKCGCCPACDSPLIERCEACHGCRCDTHPTCRRAARAQEMT